MGKKDSAFYDTVQLKVRASCYFHQKISRPGLNFMESLKEFYGKFEMIFVCTSKKIDFSADFASFYFIYILW